MEKAKKQLILYAGALVLVGSIVTTTFVTSLPTKGKKKSSKDYFNISDDKITCTMLPVKGENGDVYYALPNDYMPYLVNDEYANPGMIGIVDESDKYTVYDGSGTVTYSDGSTKEHSFEGYIGVRKDYINELLYLDAIKEAIANKNDNITTDLQSVGENLYFLKSGYSLYSLDQDVDYLSVSKTTNENGTTYNISDDISSKFIGVTDSIYNDLLELESLKQNITDAYYDEQTISRN